MEGNTSRAEAERLLGIAEKLLVGKDFNGSREFAILAQETEPLLEGSDQILAVVDVLLAAATKRVNNHHDWYAILQVDRRSDDLELIKKQYRRLAFLLHPDKNKFAWADSAFRLVAEAWAVLSDTAKKSLFDNELGLFSKVDFVSFRNQRGLHQNQFRREQEEQQQQQHKLPVRRNSPGARAGNTSANRGSTSGDETRLTSFWTACPYCYNLYEYPRVYVDCCLKCQNCERAFHAAIIPSLPPVVPGKDAYHCCWGFFPMGFMVTNAEGGKKAGLPNSMPPTFPTSGAQGPPARSNVAAEGRDGFVDVSEANVTRAQAVPKKRGRPRKNVLV